MTPVGIGLVGCGEMGRSLGRALRELPEARLLAVTDPNPAAAEAASAELAAPCAPDLSGLLALAELEAVVIASPGFLHREQTEAALAAGKHVFVEKPMAVRAVDCDAMIAAAAATARTLMVGQVLRYYPCWREVLRLVREGAVGRPWGVALTRIGGGWDGWPQAWRNTLSLSGGLLMEVNAHEIDFMTQLCGDVERVFAEGDHYGPGGEDYPNLAFLTLRFVGGALGCLHTSTVSEVNELSGKIQGSEGTLEYRDGFAAAGEIRLARRGEAPRVFSIGDLAFEPPVRHELRLFLEAVRTGRPVVLAPSGAA
jgi:predicted dehydrogenase